MSAPGPPKPKKLLGVKVKKAAVADLPTPGEEGLSTIVSGLPAQEAQLEEEQVIKGFFGKKATAPKAASVALPPKPVAAAVAAPAAAPALPPAPAAPAAPVLPPAPDPALPPALPPAPAAPSAASAPAAAATKPKKKIIIRDENESAPGIKSIIPKSEPEAKREDYRVLDIDTTDFVETEFKDVAEAIKEEQTKNPYKTPVPAKGFVSQIRRGFSGFIRQTYGQFALPSLPSVPDYDACLKMGTAGSQKAENYQYQQFVRDYMTWASPYRGLLVYHGLGSGKTCTAIAAAEALYGTSNRKVIIMTPASLKKNFLREISFCGFRHFRLLNHWVPYPNNIKTHPIVRMFATKVLNIPLLHLKKAKQIWIPDFEKAVNYTGLTAQERTEIRDQIEATLIYDPNPKNPKNGRFWFIHYNGITASTLKELACMKPSNAFDNAIIVIDEIHNLIRLMQGTIEPYLSDLKGVKRRIALEMIEPGPWTPKLCGKTMNYKRGYLLYRLLAGAQNSKIIGLSGTPLINFPEELGILANVLHGYLHIISGRVAKGKDLKEDEKIQDAIRVMATANPYLDFVDVTVDDQGVIFSITTLPEGIRKTADKAGVERIPLDEPQVNFQERLDFLKNDFTKHKIKLSSIKVNSEALLPPIGETFRDIFIEKDGITLKNENVLKKRLTGIISYYKGSRKDLMPEVTKDVVVRVPFSEYQQKVYTKIRSEEIEIESKKEKQEEGGLGAGRQGAIWADLYEIKMLKSNANYRMASRQACNFVFPSTIVRPRPRDQFEAQEEIGDTQDDIIDAPPSAVTEEDDEAVSVVLEEEKLEVGDADKEDKKTEEDEEAVYLQGKRAELIQQGVGEGDIRVALDALQKERKESQKLLLLPSAVSSEAAAAAAEALTPEEMRCRAPRLENEEYRDAIKRVKECLSTMGKRTIEKEGGLVDTSPKYMEMIKNIEESKGSSLVYSEFVSLEGIGLFTLTLDANNYDPIEIDLSAGEPKFSDRTVASLRLGPQAKKGRYIKFTGGEDEKIRRLSIIIFNAKFAELPMSMADVLSEAGYTGNQEGELCRIFCITAAGAEGLSLKNVRTVHIMEPFWNDVRMAQVKGRAVRICSHMDIQPPTERTVEIFTYITVFGPQAQAATEEKWRIAGEIEGRDSVSIAEATEMGLPIPPTAKSYVLTSDERLWVISQRKKAVIENLERAMKSAAVDCQLNYNENADGTFQCALYESAAGDFLYHPELAKDIDLTQQQFGRAAVVQAQGQAQGQGQGQAQPKVQMAKEYKVDVPRVKNGPKLPFILRASYDPATSKITHYDVYEGSDVFRVTKVGRVEYDDATQKPKKGTFKFFKA